MTTKAQAILAAAAAFQVASTEMLAANMNKKLAQETLHAADKRVFDARDSIEAAEKNLAAASMMDQDEQAHITSGDVVRLKSGGPLMTVGSMSGDTATCTWSNGPTIERYPFNVATLEKSTD